MLENIKIRIKLPEHNGDGNGGMDYDNSESNFTCDRNKEIFINEGEMTKSNLISGMKVQLRNGKYYLLVGSEFGLLLINKTWAILEDYNNDLTSRCGKEFDIVKVIIPKYEHQILLEYIEEGTVLWERIEKSPQQIEKELIISEIEKLQKRLDKLEVQ